MGKRLNFWLATATIIGTVFGAGILGLPYAINKSGFLLGLLLTGFIAIGMTLLILYVAEIVLRSHRVNQLPGIVKRYLGVKWSKLMFFLFTVGVYGALISYIIGISSVLSLLTGLNQLFYQSLIIVIGGLIVYLGLRMVQKAELLIVSTLIIVLVIICLLISPQLNINNLSKFEWGNFFYPFGVIFFALTGYSVMPELEQMLTKQRTSIMKSVVTAMLICTSAYIFFTMVFIGVFGDSVAKVSTESLTGVIGLIGNLMAVVSMSGAFIGLSLALLDSYIKDAKLSRSKAWVMTLIIPYLITVLLKPDFIQPILITGSYTGTITGFLIIATLIKARKTKGDKPAFVTPFGRVGMMGVAVLLLLGLLFTTLELLGF